MKIWNEARDSFYLKLLRTGLQIPPSEKELQTLNEDEFVQWLSKQDLSEMDKKGQFVVQVPAMVKPTCNSKKSDVVILPLSLEDNSTITGTASILEEFGTEFGISCNHDTSFLPFNENTRTFDLKEARSRFEFLKLLEKHKLEMNELKLQLERRDQGLEGVASARNDDEGTCTVDDEGGGGIMEPIRCVGVSGIVPQQHTVGVQNFQVTCTLLDTCVKLVLK